MRGTPPGRGELEIAEVIGGVEALLQCGHDAGGVKILLHPGRGNGHRNLTALAAETEARD